MRRENGLVKMLSVTFSVGMALLIFSTGAALADVQDRESRLAMVRPPVYPSYCLKKKLQGYVDFVFVVTAKGRVQDPTVVDAVVFEKNVELPVDDDKAKQAFISAARKALRKYRYEPSIKNGQVVEAEEVNTRISFMLAD